jgi:hypothetical protein
VGPVPSEEKKKATSDQISATEDTATLTVPWNGRCYSIVELSIRTGHEHVVDRRRVVVEQLARLIRWKEVERDGCQREHVTQASRVRGVVDRST